MEIVNGTLVDLYRATRNSRLCTPSQNTRNPIPNHIEAATHEIDMGAVHGIYAYMQLLVFCLVVLS